MLDPRHGRLGDELRGGAARRRLRARRRPTAAASRSSARPGTTRCRTARWASACSTTSRSPRATPRPSSGSGAWRSSTGTSTTATARRTIFWDDDSVLFVSLHQWPFYPGTGGPGEENETTRERAAAGRLGRRGVPARLRPSVVEPAVRAFEPELLLVSAGFDAHVRRPARRDARHRRRLPRAGAPLGRARAARRRRAGGRLRPETLPSLVAAALEGFRGMSNGRPVGAGRRLPRKHRATALRHPRSWCRSQVSARDRPASRG